MTLRELLARYVAARNLVGKALHELEAIVLQFEQVNGADRPVRRIGKPSVVKFREALAAKPSSMSVQDRGLTLPEVVKKFAGKDVERLSSGTVAKAVRHLGAVFSFGRKNGWIDDNPFDGMAPEARGQGGVERRGFRPDELHRLFTSPVYTGCASPNRRLKPGSMVIKDALYWLPLLGAYTGARLEEMGQALTSDIVELDSVYALRLTTMDDGQVERRSRAKQEGGKHLKTESSRRVVPLHPVLLAAGFMDYVKDAQGRGERRLFPDLKPNQFGVLTSKVSKDFGRLLHSLGMEDPELVFHSLRHGFKTACRRGRIPEEIHDYLTGHSSTSIGRRYGEQDLRTLADAVTLITFPQVDALFCTNIGAR